jgi:hypothetical protein
MRTFILALAFLVIAPAASFADVPGLGHGRVTRPSYFVKPSQRDMKIAIKSDMSSYKKLTKRELGSKAFRALLKDPKAAGYSVIQLSNPKMKDFTQKAFVKGNKVLVEQVQMMEPARWSKGTLPEF